MHERLSKELNALAEKDLSTMLTIIRTDNTNNGSMELPWKPVTTAPDNQNDSTNILVDINTGCIGIGRYADNNFTFYSYIDPRVETEDQEYEYPSPTPTHWLSFYDLKLPK